MRRRSPRAIENKKFFESLEPEIQEKESQKVEFKNLARVREARCAMCRAPGHRKLLQVHHVIAKQQLKRINRYDLMWDKRNALVLCDECHERHERAFTRVRREVLRDDNIEFALELDHGWYIERFYPKGDK